MATQLNQNTTDLRALLEAVIALPDSGEINYGSLLMASATEGKTSASSVVTSVSVTTSVSVPVGATIVKVIKCAQGYSGMGSSVAGMYGTPNISESTSYLVGEDGTVSDSASITGTAPFKGVRLTLIVLYIEPESTALDAPEIYLDDGGEQ